MAESLVKEWYRGDFGNLTTIFDDLIVALDAVNDGLYELVEGGSHDVDAVQRNLVDAAAEVTRLIDEVNWLERDVEEVRDNADSLESLCEEREEELDGCRAAEDYARRLEQVLYDQYLVDTGGAPEGFWLLMDSIARETGYSRTDVAHNQRPLGVGAE